jgi:hypothetical protein
MESPGSGTSQSVVADKKSFLFHHKEESSGSDQSSTLEQSIWSDTSQKSSTSDTSQESAALTNKDTSKTVVIDKDTNKAASNLSVVEYFPVKYFGIEDVECLEMYCLGGFHPITIGDHLHDRYQIVHKLGFGFHSVVWLAWDKRASRYVAIKINIAETDSEDHIILHQLSIGNQHTAESLQALFPPIFDEFFVTGPNGQHQCLVTLPARASLADIFEARFWLFNLPTARVIIAQLILAVCFLHSQGIVHASR